MATLDTLNRLCDTLRKAGIPIHGASITDGQPPTARIDYDGATALQVTQGDSILSTFDWSSAADATWVAQQAKANASAEVDRGSLQAGLDRDRLIVALAGMILDEFNLHTTFEGNLLSAVAAATSLADLKTRYAAITPVPQRTAAQLVNAIKNKIAATAE